MKPIINLIFCCSALLTLFLSPLCEGNISGVMGPNINPNDRSLQFRTAISFGDNSEQQDNWLYRLHYQHAFNDSFRGRIVMQYRDRGRFEYDFFRTELLYSFKKRGLGESWSSAVRFDLRTRRGSRPEGIAVNWGNQWDLGGGYRARATLILGKQMGGNRQLTNVTVQTRGSISRKLENGLRLGLQMLNSHGEIDDFGSISEQGIFLGPAISGKVGEYNVEFRYLNGMSSAVRNHNLFFRVTKKF